MTYFQMSAHLDQDSLSEHVKLQLSLTVLRNVFSLQSMCRFVQTNTRPLSDDEQLEAGTLSPTGRLQSGLTVWTV